MKSLLPAFVLISACAGPAAGDENAIFQKKELVAHITRQCGLPNGSILVRSDGSLRLRPKLDERYERVDCALARIRKAGLIREIPRGFVGNERYDENLQ